MLCIDLGSVGRFRRWGRCVVLQFPGLRGLGCFGILFLRFFRGGVGVRRGRRLVRLRRSRGGLRGGVFRCCVFRWLLRAETRL